jgi:hypothetical protein
MWLRTLDGRPVCERDVVADETSAAWLEVTLQCVLGEDGIATFAVETTGVRDLEFEKVAFRW